MKELTVAQGLLRCGECDTIFDAMKALSNTLPEEHAYASNPPYLATQVQDDPQQRPSHIEPMYETEEMTPREKAFAGSGYKNSPPPRRLLRSQSFLWISLMALVLLLLLQLAYGARGWLAQQPFTAKLSQNLCTMVGCETPPPRNIKQIKMLHHNVYAHPNAPDVLIISSSIQNEAPFGQPYPLLEVRFFNNDSEVVALRRFSPKEYLDEGQAENLMKPGMPKEFSLNISDPGVEAVRFQFRFL